MLQLTKEQYDNLLDLIGELGSCEKEHYKYSTFHITCSLLLNKEDLQYSNLPESLDGVEAVAYGYWSDSDGLDFMDLNLSKTSYEEFVEDYDMILLELVEDNQHLFSKDYIEKLRKGFTKIKVSSSEKVEFEVIK